MQETTYNPIHYLILLVLNADKLFKKFHIEKVNVLHCSSCRKQSKKYLKNCGYHSEGLTNVIHVL